ncbi:MAG: hypothetical protein L6V85_06840 [Clostridiales bacterium]|nr:MAG: hypothetical protein L6V85_06840 [Clostridiales bacterium]
MHELELRLEPLAKASPRDRKSTTLFIRNLKTPKSITLFIVTKNNKSVVDAITEKNSKKIILDTVKFEQEYQENETNYEKYKDIIAKKSTKKFRF